MARTRAAPRAPVFVLTRRKVNTTPSEPPTRPFPLASLPRDLLQALCVYLTLPEVCELIKTGDSALLSALALHLQRPNPDIGPKLRWERNPLLPCSFLPLLPYLPSLRELHLPNLATGQPWARMLIQEVPQQLEKLSLTFRGSLSAFFEDAEPVSYEDEDDPPTHTDMLRKTAYEHNVAKYPKRVGVETFFAHFCHLTSLKLLCLSSMPKMNIERFAKSLPRCLTKLSSEYVYETSDSNENTDQASISAMLSALPRGLLSLKLQNVDIPVDALKDLPPNLTSLAFRCEGVEEPDRYAPLLPASLTSLYIYFPSDPKDDFFKNMAAWPHLQKVHLDGESQDTGLTLEMPPQLTSLTALHWYRQALRAPSPFLSRNLKKLRLGVVYMPLQIAQALPRSLEQLTTLEFESGHNDDNDTSSKAQQIGRIMDALPRGLRDLSVDYISEAISKHLPPNLTRFSAYGGDDIDLALMPRQLLSLQLNSSKFTSAGILQLPSRLTSLNLGYWCSLPDSVAPILPKSLTSLSLYSIRIKLPKWDPLQGKLAIAEAIVAQAGDSEEDEVGNKWTLPNPEQEPERTAQEIAYCEDRIKLFLSVLVDGCSCRFWFSCNAFLVKTSVVLHTYCPQYYQTTPAHRTKAFDVRAKTNDRAQHMKHRLLF